MKKVILVVTGVAVVLTGAYFGSYLSAQAPATGAAPQVTGTRVAVVNIGMVFHKYKRALAVKQELEEILAPFKKRGKDLTDQMKAWHEELQKTADAKRKEGLEENLRNGKRQLEDMQLQVQKMVSKKQEDNLITLWKEVNTGIDRVAQAYGFQLVLGYGDPFEPELMGAFPNINRKMQAMDAGGTVPLYVHGSVDLSSVIADTLNRWLDEASKGKVQATPTSNSK